MDFWPEFLASSWGKEFVAGGFGGMAGIVSGYPLDTVRIRQQSSVPGSAFSILRRVVTMEGPGSLYRGMGAPLASVTFQNAMVFQIYAILSRAFDSSNSPTTDPPSYTGVALGGVGTGALQSLMLAPVELVKIRHHCPSRCTFSWLLLLDVRIYERTASSRLQKERPRNTQNNARSRRVGRGR